MIVSGSHCCLLLSSLIEANIGVIIKESKSNITHQRAYQQMQQIQGKKKVQVEIQKVWPEWPEGFLKVAPRMPIWWDLGVTKSQLTVHYEE